MKRALTDRSVDVVEEFSRAVHEIDARAAAGMEGHASGQRLVEQVNADDLISRGITAVYADPPYTAQQYSRFYHVLDVLTTGVPVRFQQVGGKVTSGLYPDDKYLSPFSSRSQAPSAFRHLLSITREADADVVISYSAARGSGTGNARMISLDSLVALVEEIFGKNAVTVKELDLRYRQFNSGSREVAGRYDPEFIVKGVATHAG